jgi:regulator of sigma E protease
MTILIFFIILLILVLSHEFGHFIAAKAFRIRVDEFAFGFPPRLFSKTIGETRYAFNALPLGGYVKIYGEDPTQVTDDADKARSFPAQKRWKQAIVIVAGVVFNLLLAWVAVTGTYLVGAPAVADNDLGPVVDQHLTITGIEADSPAKKAGFKEGDILVGLEEGGAIKQITSANEVQAFTSIREGKEIHAQVLRGDAELTLTVVPVTDIVPDRAAVGISMDMVGKLKLPFFTAVKQGFLHTVLYTQMTTEGIFHFLKTAIIGQSDFKDVAGPVGIVNAVGDAAKLGFVNLLLFTALISINLAVINVLPFPALDGGRLLFIIIESIVRRPIPAKVANYTNLVGFALLMLLMIVVTFHDIAKLF